MIIQTTKEWFYIAEETSDIDRRNAKRSNGGKIKKCNVVMI